MLYVFWRKQPLVSFLNKSIDDHGSKKSHSVTHNVSIQNGISLKDDHHRNLQTVLTLPNSFIFVIKCGLTHFVVNQPYLYYFLKAKRRKSTGSIT